MEKLLELSKRLTRCNDEVEIFKSGNEAKKKLFEMFFYYSM